MKKTQQTIFFDGTKAVNAWNVDDMTGWTVNGMTGDPKIAEYMQTVAWLYRGVIDRANNVAKMPFAIYRGDQEVDNSVKYKNALGFMRSPMALFKKIEMSLVMTGKAYIRCERNSGGYVGNLKYLVPTTIKEVYNDIGEIVSYERTINGKKIIIPAKDIIPIYVPDYNSENGPGSSYPAKAALASARVLVNIDDFVAKFFERGAIKATILTTMGFSEVEAQKAQHWWDDVVSGIENAWSAVVLKGEKVNATVIGEGLESLNENSPLTTERRQNIATAIGVPESRMWSSAANYATAVQDDKNYINGTIIPECDLIAEAFNQYLFTRENRLDGYILDFQYEALDMFQEAAADQAAGVSTLVTAGVPLLMAMDLMGMDLTDEQRAELQSMDAPDQSVPETPQVEMVEEKPEQERIDDSPMIEDMKRWQRKSIKRLRDGKSAACEFDSHYIPAVTNAAIFGALETCQSDENIRGVFNQYIVWVEYP